MDILTNEFSFIQIVEGGGEVSVNADIRRLVWECCERDWSSRTGVIKLRSNEP